MAIVTNAIVDSGAAHRASCKSEDKAQGMAEQINPKLKVLLADDHQMVREALTPFIRRIGRDVQIFQAGTLDEAVAEASRSSPLDLIILDIRMPGMHGLAGLREMRERYPGVPIVMLSGVDDPDDMAECLRLGANGFIPKTMIGAGLVSALKLVLSGERFIPSGVFFKGKSERSERIGVSDSVRHEPDALAKFTDRQRMVLRELVEGYPNKEIAKQLGIEEITVKVHLQRIFRLLGVSNRVQAVRRAFELGLRPRQ